MENLRRYWGVLWRPALSCLGVGLVLYIVLFSRLGSLQPLLHASEITAYQSSSSLGQVIDNPVNAPHTILQFLFHNFIDQSAFWIRAASAVFGALAIALFFYLLQRWHTTRVAFLGSVLFATSSALLHVARLGTPATLLSLGVLALLAIGVRLEREGPNSLGLLLCAAVFGILLYIPGFIWLIAIGLIWRHKKVFSLLSSVSWPIRVATALLMILLLAPLLYASWYDLSIVRELAGIPAHLPSPITWLKNLGYIPLSLFFRSPVNAATNLGSLPLLDIFATLMFALGVYAHWFTRRSERTQFLFGSLVIGALLVSFNGSVSLALLTPGVYIITAAGITLLLQQWFTVFPRNPLARGVGVTLVTAAVLLTSFYHFNRYFVAWANAPETKQVFTERIE